MKWAGLYSQPMKGKAKMNWLTAALAAIQAIRATGNSNFNSAQSAQNKFKSSAGERIFK